MKILDKSTALNVAKVNAMALPVIERVFNLAAGTPEIQNARGSMYA